MTPVWPVAYTHLRPVVMATCVNAVVHDLIAIVTAISIPDVRQRLNLCNIVLFSNRCYFLSWLCKV